MYTATLLSDVINPQLRRRMVEVEFTDGETTFSQTFQFRADDEVQTIKKSIAGYLAELNMVVVPLDNLTPEPDPEPVPPTAKELAKQDFDASVEEYKNIKEMNAILPAIYSQWMLDNQVVICQQKYQTWQNTPA
jgi:hypothetical protein